MGSEMLVGPIMNSLMSLVSTPGRFIFLLLSLGGLFCWSLMLLDTSLSLCVLLPFLSWMACSQPL